MPNRALLTLVSLALLAAPVQAQDSSPAETPVAEAEPPPEYAERIHEALEESNQGNWNDARAAFREAHALFPNARTSRGMGMVAFEIRDYVDCVRHLRRSLADEVRALTERQRVEVEALLGRALERVAVFTLDEAPEGAAVSVDGRVLEREDDGSILLPIGDHALVVEAEARWESRIRVRGGENGALPMVFTAPEAEPDDPPPGAPAAPGLSASTETPVGGLALTIAGIVTFLAGGAVLAAGVADYLSVQNAADLTEWSTLADANDRSAFLQGVGYAMMGVGVALTIGGVVWLASVSSDGSAQLRVRGTF